MKYLRQTFIILSITLMAEALKALLPLPIPASIYGLVLIFAALASGALPLEKIEETADFLLDVMPLMFVPALVGAMEVFLLFKGLYLQTLIIVVVTTILTMVLTGRVSQGVIRARARRRQGGEG